MMEKVRLSEYDALAIIKQEQQTRADKCLDEISNVLEDNNCAIHVFELRINGNVVDVGWRVVPKTAQTGNVIT